MSHLLPPNLLKLFAPRPQPPFLKPLTRDERIRGPNNLGGVAGLAKRIKEEAEDAEVKQGMDLNPEKALDEQKEENVKAELKQDGEDGEVAEDSGKDRKKKTARDKIAEMGIIGEEAVKLRKELRKKRQEEYKKSAEANCEYYLAFLFKATNISADKPQDDAQAIGDPYKTLFISRLVSNCWKPI